MAQTKQKQRPGTVPVKEAAARVGVNKKTLYAAVAAGQVPSVRIGRTIRIPRSWVEQACGENGHRP